MANKRLDYDKIYELVMQCRKSGLSDKQWCLDNNIAPSTFYYWIRKLQQRACYDLPDMASRKENVPVVRSLKGNSVISAILQYRVPCTATNCLLMSGVSKKKATHTSR